MARQALHGVPLSDDGRAYADARRHGKDMRPRDVYTDRRIVRADTPFVRAVPAPLPPTDA
jgi:hypothetical protein